MVVEKGVGATLVLCCFYLGGGGEGGGGDTGCRGDEVGFEADDGCHLGVPAVDAVRRGVHHPVHRELVVHITVMQQQQQQQQQQHNQVRLGQDIVVATERF